jgi:hypothetical protein
MKARVAILVGALAVGFLASEARAEFKSSPFVSRVSFDGRMLEVGYLTGGGCQDHRGDIEMTVDESVTPAVITTEVVDITNQEDPCEAGLILSATVDLSEKIAEYERQSGHQLIMPKVILPVIDYQKPSSLIPSTPGTLPTMPTMPVFPPAR